MKRLYGQALVGLLLLAGLGCGQAAPTTPQVVDSTPTATSEDDGAFPAPDFSQPSTVSLISSENQSRVGIGDGEDSFKAAFPRSPADSRSLDGQLPVGTSPDHWSAKGWALDNASKGVGALFYDDRIAMAMVQLDSVDDDVVVQEVTKYQPNGLFQFIGDKSKRVRYWFWVRGHATLMICAFKTGQNDINLTTAIGDSAVMARMHMSYATAQDDAAAVGRMFSTREGSASVADSLE